MARGFPSRTRTGSKRIPCAPSSPRPRACVRTGGGGGSSLLDPTPQLSRLKVRKLDIYSYCVRGCKLNFLIDICCAVTLCLSLESMYATNLHLNSGRIIRGISPHPPIFSFRSKPANCLNGCKKHLVRFPPCVKDDFAGSDLL